MVKAKKWIKSTEFTGMPTVENFRLEEEELPALKDGGMGKKCSAANLSLVYHISTRCTSEVFD